MRSLPLDPRFTFDTFVVGPATRLATAAARRVAEAPGSAYNPLFLYSASGLGKTHLIMAIGQHARRVHPDIEVVYDTLEHMMESIMTAIQSGERDAFRHRLRDAGLLILDDVQFLAGQRGAQEELLRAWDSLSSRGGQVVLASDRPPTEIDDLDDRLLSRFSGGLIADLDVPDYETRIAIVKRKADERGQLLSPGVAETLARVGFGNVRELQGGLNRVLAVQELDERQVDVDEAARLVGAQPAPKPGGGDEFGDFLAEVSGALAHAIAEPTPEQRLADAILHWGAEGYRTQRLESALASAPDRAAADALLTTYHADIERLGAIAGEIRALDSSARELSRLDVLRNPDRVSEAETLLDQVRARLRAFPPPPSDTNFETLPIDGALFAVRAARAIAAAPGGAYNPFFIHAPEGSGKSDLLAAIGNAALANGIDGVAFLRAETFCSELITAIEHNLVDSWRARFRRARVLIVDDLDALAGTERAQEELFHLFDELRGAGAQLVFAATVPPRDLEGLEERLRTRLESGLVLDLAEELREQERELAFDAEDDRMRAQMMAREAAGPPPPAAGEAGEADGATAADAAAASAGTESDSRQGGVAAMAGVSTANGGPDVASTAGGEAPTDEAPARAVTLDDWFLSREKVTWEWPHAGDWLVEELN